MTSKTKKEVLHRTGGYIFAVFFIIAGWWITSLLLNSPALPTPVDTFIVLSGYFVDMLPDFWISTYRVVVSIFIGTVIGVPVAMACARSEKLDYLFAPVLYLLYPVPKVILLPILLTLLGLADAPKIFLISLTVFFQVLVAVRDSVKAIPEDKLLSIRALGASQMNEIRHVVIPSTLPSVFTSLRISTGTAIAVLFFAEAIVGSTGIGYFIMQSWSMVNYPRMFAGIIALAILGVGLYAIFDIVERRLTRWKGRK
ncbi:MAG: ABC transporter permease [Coriobacteriales bacterium]|jgi:ABC-type nitrate/sulfonate/bicarbonate transport system permease component